MQRVTTSGLPGQSGVGGGAIAVSPGKLGIAVTSPPLDEAGHGVRRAASAPRRLESPRQEPLRPGGALAKAGARA